MEVYDEDLMGLLGGRKERRMQDVNGYQVYGTAAVLSPEFNQKVLGPLTANETTIGRKLLQTQTQLTFYGTIKQGVVSDRAVANYVFNQDSVSFLNIATQSGTTFTFLKALLILPQEQTATNVPPYVTSTTGFFPKDVAHPTIVHLTTQGATAYAPQIALRFDYSQTIGSPLISIYYTDRMGAADQGMSCSAVLVAIATLFLAQGSFAQTTQAINRLVPVTAKIQSSLSIGASYEVTPTAPLRKRRLAERIRDDMESEDLSSTRRKLLEQTSTVVPPSVSSTTGFLSTKPSEPVIVRLSTLGSSSGVVPNVALRFDYASKVPGTTPFFSLYFSDLVGAYPKGVPKANLAQTYGIYVGEDGTIYPGQQGR
ncbi:hypothetical protein WJX75_002760 [Coccomyxa subellipsoidea]|uniref:Peptidylprolyl isomerase n=1 Tax=Coccomyxa subellipsoidea TaxID=248742 RepID=A0ABR2YV96_9CHLO